MATPSLRLCSPCGYQGSSQVCPQCGGKTKMLRAVQDAGTEARARSVRRKDVHACPRCGGDVGCVRRGDLPPPPPRPPAERICAPCGTSGTSPRCPRCGGRTVALKAVAQAERSALPEDRPPETFPAFDESLALLLDHRCGACAFLFACGEKPPAEELT